MENYVALLRGINVGGNKKVPMTELKEMCEKLGLGNVKTLLNTGNVLFSAKGTEAALEKKIATAFKKTFGFESTVIVRSLTDIEKLVKRDPFKTVKVTKDIRLYVTFLQDTPKGLPKMPYRSSDGSNTVLEMKDKMLISVLDLSKGKGTTDAMDDMTKKLGKQITTRNWNTVLKFLS